MPKQITKNSPSKEYAENYCSMALKNIQKIMKTKGISQKSLAIESGLSQSTISKLLHGDSKASLVHIVQICHSLKIDPIEIFSSGFVVPNNTLQADGNNGVYTQPAQYPLAFNGYLHRFNVYFHSTISSENNILHGILTFQESSSGDYCSAELILNTGKKQQDGTPITKHYTGSLIISLTQSACYCMLTSNALGETCFLIFHHMFLFNEKLICRMACSATVSSGGNRRPTMHRLLICRPDMNISDPQSSDYKFIRGQLMLNSSKIYITETALQKIETEEAEFLSKINMNTILNEFKSLCKNDTIYFIDEAEVQNMAYDSNTKLCFLSLLREYSIAERYNKISSKSDDLIFNYMENRKTMPPS